jgi:hypothetical protein
VTFEHIFLILYLKSQSCIIFLIEGKVNVSFVVYITDSGSLESVPRDVFFK